MPLSSLFCLMLVVLHVEETVASASFSVLVPKEILASPGDTLTLPCSVTPAFHPNEVRWYRPDKYTTPILLYKNPQIDEQVAADPQYRGRASLIGGPEVGNVSLKLENITMADSGEYVCYIHQGSWYEKASLHVKVRVLGSVPLISVSDEGSGQVKVTCQSEGWSPKPTLTWRNAKGNEIKKGLHEADFSEDNYLMSVSSWMLVSPSDSDGLFCSVGVSGLETRESRVALHLFGERACISASTAWKDVFIAILALSLLGIGMFYLYKKGLIKWPLFQKTTKSQDGTVEENVKLGTEESMQHEARSASRTEERNSEQLREVKAEEPGLHSDVVPKKPKGEDKETNTEVDVSQIPEWDQAKEYKETLFLDGKTCPRSLEVKDKGKAVLCPHPEKIHGHESLFPHVLCEGPLTSGRYYWEVDMKNKTDKQSWYVGVCSTAAAKMTTRVPVIPENGFWVLQYEKGTGLFANTKPPLPVPTTKLLSKLGVYLKAYGKGINTLSFYSVEKDKRAERGWPLCSFKCFIQEGGLIPVLSPGLRDKHPLTIC